MKKTVVALIAVTLLAVGAAVYAHGPDWAVGYACPAYSSGYHMIGPSGYGGPMMGWRGGYDQKFLDETADLRKELNNKQFEYSEIIRNPKTTKDTITKLEQEIQDIQEKLYAKAPRGINSGFRHCWKY